MEERRRQKGRNGEGKAVMYIVYQKKRPHYYDNLADVTSFVTFVNELWRKQELKLKNIAVIASGHSSRTQVDGSIAVCTEFGPSERKPVKTKTRETKMYVPLHRNMVSF